MHENFWKATPEKQEAVIKAGMDAFARDGYTQANTVDIVAACGIAKGSLFHYFGNKKGFFLFLVRLCADRIVDETEKRYAAINEDEYINRLRKGVLCKISLPLDYPAETALLAKVFSEMDREVADELRTIAAGYGKKMRDLNSRHIGTIERQMIRDGIDFCDAQAFLQMVLDGVTTRLLQQYAGRQQELLSNPEILTRELDKAVDFILFGIGKGERK